MRMLSKNSNYVRYHFHGILGISGPFVTIFGDKSQKLSLLTLTICINIQTINNGTNYYNLLLWYDFFCGGKMKIILTFLLWFYPCCHSFCTTTIHDKLKFNLLPAHLWSNLSISFEIKLIPCFLRLLCACQQSVRPTPLLTETCS